MKYSLCLVLALLSFSAFSQTIQISGRCYYDANGNHVFDGDDSVLANREVQANYSDVIYYGNTDEFGIYHLTVDTGSYDIFLIGPIDYDNYEDLYEHRQYSDAGYDTVDFAYQKRDSIVSLIAYIETPNNNIPYTGATRQYRLVYGFDGFLQNMPASVTLNFNPLLTLVSATPSPNVISNGKLEWNFEDVQRIPFGNSPSDSISLVFDYPATGDTIGLFVLSPNFIPGVTVTTPVHYFQISDYTERVDLAAVQPAGPTSGVKWLRHFSGNSNSYDEGLSIDTAQDGHGYFLGAQKTIDSGSTTFTQSLPFIAKLNKDGLSVWEKYLVNFPVNSVSTYLTAIRHTSDGGCIVLAGASLPTTTVFNYDNAVVVASFDSLGNLRWSTLINGSRSDEPGQNIEVLADGSCIFTGTTSSSDGDFYKNTSDTSFTSVFVSKLSPTGAIVFTRVYGGSKHDYGYKITTLKNGSFLVLAGTESNDGDVGDAHQHFTIQPNGRDTLWSEEGWVFNVFGNGGDIIWSKCYGGRKNSYFTGSIENNGGILLTGVTNSKDGDLPYYTEAFVPLWALQISSAGSIIWSKPHPLYHGYQDTNYVSFPDDIYDNYTYSSLHQTQDGNYIAGGIASDKYGGIQGKHGSGDFSFVKLNTTGDILWQKAVGGTGYDLLNDVQLDSNDDILFVGSSNCDNDDLYQHAPSFNKLMVVGKIGIANVIKGQVFIDSNGNHIKDEGEHYYSGGRINTLERSDTMRTSIFNGLFLSNVDTGNYLSSYHSPNTYYTVYPPDHVSTFGYMDQTDSFDFALTPAPNIIDLEIELLPLSPARVGYNTTYRIITKNVGTTNISDVLVGLRKDNRQNYVDASRPYSGIMADSIWWGPFTLNAFEADTIFVSFTLASPPTLNVADTLSLAATANPVLNDSSAANNVFYLKENVKDAVAPNDKTEIHAGTLSSTQYAAGEYLQYQINFQNTGTDTAFFITVKDTLQSKLDLQTLEMVSSSHPYTFRLEGNVATWDFKKIKLPGSSTDAGGSHGFVSFKAKPRAGLTDGDEFTNKAAIYFDYNLPVITNQDKTILGVKPGICPNASISFTTGVTGTSFQWQVNNGNGFTDLSNSGIYDGVNTATLILTAPPTGMHGYKFRCVVDGTNYSPETILKFAVRWNGNESTAWENAANWDCGILPDENTDVIIPSSAQYPLVSSGAVCYSLRLLPGTSVIVNPGFNLVITGKGN